MPLLRSIATFLPRLLDRARDVGLLRTSASLSYTTLLGLVPLVTVVFAFVARFPFFSGWLDELEKFLLQYLLPSSAANVVRVHVLGLATHAAKLTGLSILLIAVTALMLIATVDREINEIWGITHRRSLYRRTAMYLFGLTLGPVLVGASLSLSSFVVSRSLALVPLEHTRAALVGNGLPFAFTAVALSLLYAIAPAHRVPTSAAVIGGVIAALAFEGAKQGFAWYVTHLASYEMVYGALAALPALMLWIYLSWFIVLSGAVVTATLVLPGRARRRDAFRR